MVKNWMYFEAFRKGFPKRKAFKSTGDRYRAIVDLREKYGLSVEPAEVAKVMRWPVDRLVDWLAGKPIEFEAIAEPPAEEPVFDADAPSVDLPDRKTRLSEVLAILGKGAGLEEASEAMGVAPATLQASKAWQRAIAEGMVKAPSKVTRLVVNPLRKGRSRTSIKECIK